MGAQTDEIMTTDDATEKIPTTAKEQSQGESVPELAVTDLEEGSDDTPKKKKKKSKSSQGLSDSVASLSLDNEDADATNATKKKKKKIGSKSKDLNASSASLSVDATDDKNKKKKKSKSKDLEGSAMSLSVAEAEEDSSSSGKPDDADKVISLVTEDIWKSEGAESLEALYAILQEDDTRDYEKNRKIASRIGAPLLTVRKMKDFETNVAIQTCGLNLLICFAKMVTPPWYELVAVGGLERAMTIVQKAENADLRELALSWLEIIVAKKEATKYFIEKDGVSCLVFVLENQPDLMGRALGALHALNSSGGHLGRAEVAKKAAFILENSEEPKILKAAFSLMEDMVATEELCKSLVEGKGVDSLAYALKHFQEKPDLHKKAFVLLISLSSNGGKSARRAIAEQGTLKTIENLMSGKPKDVDIQKRSCDFIFAMSTDQRKAIKDSGVLPLISKIFTIHRNEKGAILKVANKAMNAVLS